MESLNRYESLDNNHETVVRIVDSFSRACGVTCRVMNLQGKLLYMSDPNIRNKSIKNLHASDDSVQFDQINNQTIRTNSADLISWSVPIQESGTFLGVLVAGPVQLQNHGTNENTLMEQNQIVPVVSAERMNSLSEMLQLAARKLSDEALNHTPRNGKAFQVMDTTGNWKNNYKSLDNCIYSSTIYPFDKERQLLECVETGDKAGAQVVLNEILGAVFFASSASQPVILTRVTELMVLLSRAAIKGGANAVQIFGQNFACMKKIHNFRTIDEIAYWLSGILARFTEQVLDQGDARDIELIAKAKEFVKKNYMKRITLEDVAAHVFLSPTYFSRIFKEKTGKNFNVYVNEVRIEAAKKHLVDEKASMIDISLMTGFEDQSYFSKVFKRMTGVTPNKFRESRGRAISSSKA